MESQQAIVDFNWFCQIWMLMPQSLFGYTLWLVRLNFITQFPEKRKSSLPFLSWIFADILSNQKLYFVAFKGYMPTYLLFSPYLINQSMFVFGVKFMWMMTFWDTWLDSRGEELRIYHILTVVAHQIGDAYLPYLRCQCLIMRGKLTKNPKNIQLIGKDRIFVGF